jgi:hypothetical protein
LIAPRAVASRFSIEASQFALPMTAPISRYCTAFGPFFEDPYSRTTPAEAAPPKGGLLTMAKPMTLYL